MSKIIFLDYDGVLHPDKAYQTRRGIVLRCDGHDLFEHAELLTQLLQPHGGVKIVLSTSWVRVLGYDRARERLPQTLQDRLIGATYHSTMEEWFPGLPRYKQILGYVRRHALDDWIAIDNDAIGWPEDQADRLVHTDDWGGLGDQAPQQKLIEWLSK
jgi:hypothetical protein